MMAGKATAPEDLSPFSKRVREAFESTDLTLTALARFCEVSPQALSHLVSPSNGRQPQGCRFAPKLAKALGVSVEWLLYGEGQRTPAGAAPLVLVTPPVQTSGLSPLQVGALDTLANLMRSGKLTDAKLVKMLQAALGDGTT